jgi:hypothetical protein
VRDYIIFTPELFVVVVLQYPRSELTSRETCLMSSSREICLTLMSTSYETFLISVDLLIHALHVYITEYSLMTRWRAAT